jgi:serine/threonine protein kinase
MPLAPGTQLGPYEITAPLGAGGMGEVYRARDTRLGRDVAVKVLPQHLSSDPDLKARFEREARTISALSHPHVCHLYDVGSQDGTDYLVMELLEGESLADRLKKGPLPLKEALQYGIEVADALEIAHNHGIVHRDLKPGNVMLTKSGAKLLDFGLAKPKVGVVGAVGSSSSGKLEPSTPTMSIAVLSTPAPELTQQGMVVGTFQYMAPEVLQGQETDARSDIFALGAVLYEMISGKRAFEGKSQLSVMTAILEKEPERMAQAPPALEHVVQTCLAKDPANAGSRQAKWFESFNGPTKAPRPHPP